MTVSLVFEGSRLAKDVPNDGECRWQTELERVVPETDGRATSVRIDDECLTVASVAALVRFVRAHSATLSSVSVSRCTGAIDTLLSSVVVSGTVRHVLLSFARQQDRGLLERCFQVLAVALRVSPCLQELDLQLSFAYRQTFPVSLESATALAEGLAGNRTLRRLCLYRSSFAGSSAVRALADGLRQNVGIRDFDLLRPSTSSGGPLADADLSELLQGLADCRKLRKISLSECRCHSATLSALAPLTDRLEELRIANAIYSRDDRMDVSVMVAALSQTRTLRKLTLYNCGLDDTSTASIAVVLRHSTCIQRLEMAFNDITDVGMSILAEAASEWQSLTYIDLYACTLHDKSILAEWADALEANPVLSHILLEAHLYKQCPRLEYTMMLNAVGRVLLEREDQTLLPPGVWAHVLARANKKYGKQAPGAIYYFLCELPDVIGAGPR